MFDSISWEEDAMTIHIGKMKNDQEGANAFARHVYANPKNPVVCPVLAMSILVFTKGYDRSASSSSTRYIFGESDTSTWPYIYGVGFIFFSERHSYLVGLQSRWSCCYKYLAACWLESGIGTEQVHVRGGRRRRLCHTATAL